MMRSRDLPNGWTARHDNASPRLPTRTEDEAFQIAQLLVAYFFPNASKLNFWPPTLASNMRPPLPVVKTATPFWYLAFADAPLVAATALAWAASANVPFWKSVNAGAVSKKMISE